MEAIWVAAEMRAGGAYAHSTVMLTTLAEDKPRRSRDRGSRRRRLSVESLPIAVDEVFDCVGCLRTGARGSLRSRREGAHEGRAITAPRSLEPFPQQALILLRETGSALEIFEAVLRMASLIIGSNPRFEATTLCRSARSRRPSWRSSPARALLSPGCAGFRLRSLGSTISRKEIRCANGRSAARNSTGWST